jgi:hypothetical protein
MSLVLKKGKKKIKTKNLVPYSIKNKEVKFENTLNFESIYIQEEKTLKYLEEENRITVVISTPKGTKTAGMFTVTPTDFLNNSDIYSEIEMQRVGLDRCPDKYANIYYKISLEKLRELDETELMNELAFDPTMSVVTDTEFSMLRSLTMSKAESVNLEVSQNFSEKGVDILSNLQKDGMEEILSSRRLEEKFKNGKVEYTDFDRTANISGILSTNIEDKRPMSSQRGGKDLNDFGFNPDKFGKVMKTSLTDLPQMELGGRTVSFGKRSGRHINAEEKLKELKIETFGSTNHTTAIAEDILRKSEERKRYLTGNLSIDKFDSMKSEGLSSEFFSKKS